LITGGFGLGFVRLMPMVQVSLQLPGITDGFVVLDFLVDSGSTDSYLHPQDAKGRLGISDTMLSSSQLWPGIRSSRGIGGTAMSYAHPAIYSFRHDDGRIQQVEGDIQIAVPSQTNATFPSLLGWDILRFFRFELDYVSLSVTLR
jgi:hypothetical protein